MSLATRCTHCGTIFKIVQDQLKVSEGWVRCGRCNEIFNALPGLFDLEREPPPPRPKPRTPAPDPTSSTTSADADTSSAASATAATAAIAPESGGGVVVDNADTPQPEQDWEKTAPIRPSMVEAARQAISTPPVEPRAPAPTTVNLPPQAESEPLPEAAPAPGIENDLPETPPAAGEGTTEFDLDTSVQGYVDKPSTVVQAVESLNLSDNPQPWLGTPPENDVPETDESDALDSRYLMPSTRERKSAKRRPRGPEPEFADAEFPDEAFLDAAEDDWASGFGPSGLHGTSPGSGYGSSAGPASKPATDAAYMAGAAEANLAIPPSPTEQAGDGSQPEFVPERALEPPSKRTGKPGTRGRDPSTQTPDFMRRAQRQAFWRHPITRGILSLIGLGLVGALGLQVTHQFRDLIAAHHPGARPYLAQWCAYAGCTIQPPLRLDDLQVESATLVRANSEGPDNYRLAVVVHNRASIALAWPHIDLTLTDDSGAVIARRAFLPSDAEWIDTADAKAETAPRSAAARGNTPAATTTPAAAPADRSTTLLWHLRAPDIKPAGYTAELFYP